MTNRLKAENSPYLLQHVNNPVDWYPWSEEAFEIAKKTDRPVFLSIGYAACHWCHVMAHESFEDPDIADIMNLEFVNIKVDREERPDIDSIYMNAVVAMTGQGGWPMSVFLTPDAKPFYGGTYFPPSRRFNRPSFREILLLIARLWREDRARLLQSGDQITNHIFNIQQVQNISRPLKEDILEQAVQNLAQSYDWTHGGWGQAPKFPQPMVIQFLLRRFSSGDQVAGDMAIHALDSMARGGIYDVIGGGFARYSTDDRWLVPHFEKMLYDNAQLARCYLHGYLLTGNEHYKGVCEDTLDFMIQEMSSIENEGSKSGGFYSSIDADSEGIEGKYYLWSYDDLQRILRVDKNNNDEFDLFKSAFDVDENGNFEGMIVLQRELSDAELAEKYGIQVSQVQDILRNLLDKLLNERAQRTRPATDDKVLVSWNSLALISFSEAARYLQRDDYLDVARKNADFLLTELQVGNRLLRSWRNGHAKHNGFLEDYGGLTLALISLYQSDPDIWWYRSAHQLAVDMLDLFLDPDGGFFDTRKDHEALIYRPKDVQDNATPSGNALAVQALLRLSTLTGNGSWWDVCESALESLIPHAERYPTAFGEWLSAFDYAIGNVKEVVIIGDPKDQRSKALIEKLWSEFRPNMIAAISSNPVDSSAPDILINRPLLNNQPTVYVCENFICKRPVNTPAELEELLRD